MGGPSSRIPGSIGSKNPISHTGDPRKSQQKLTNLTT